MDMNNINSRTWADNKMEELHAIGKDNWTQDDWDTFNYIMQVRFDSGYYDGQEY